VIDISQSILPLRCSVKLASVTECAVSAGLLLHTLAKLRHAGSVGCLAKRAPTRQ